MNLTGPLGRAVLGRRRGGGADAYLAFLAHIQAKESPTTLAWSTASTPYGAARILTTADAGALGAMFGSPWADFFFPTNPGRVVQHAVSSEAQFNAIVANGRAVWFRLAEGPTVNYNTSVARNGYTSLGYGPEGSPYSNSYCTEIIWWDETLGPRTRNPQVAGAETAYTF